ncbi:hypothetical protein HGI30_20700 [Paenibacillus albicereus]|uniref:Uncharacterized protein n=1 Tax=Paenibacillus albicereus TaxID=2726185 RepID=A0A6H2H236_9BACL|nr:hypothetical protein [Paenibacillus albicereus]QJC53705.1 hypothetical protein HGI30_20700 [Paenibacillus albicereus]
MKRPAKLLLAGSLLLVAAVSASWFLSADNNGDRNSAYAQTPILDEFISGKTFKRSFAIPEHLGWVTVQVENEASDSIAVRITEGSSTGKEKMRFTLKPGEQKPVLGTSPWSAGNHTIALSSSKGYEMSGRVSVKLEDSPAAVGLPAKPSVSAGTRLPDEDAAWSGRSSGSKITSVSFEVLENHGFVALDFLNEGKGATTVSVSRSSSGEVSFTERVEPGQPFAWSSGSGYPEGMPSGTYTVSFRSSTAEVEMSYSGRASQSGNS